MTFEPETSLPVGKLPPAVLDAILKRAPLTDQRIVQGPGVGVDCAVIEMGESLLVFKSDPITFASDEIGWYAVQVCTNDIATTGAKPNWFLSTLLLPEGKTTPHLAEQIMDQVYDACRQMGISAIGGHTEITYGLDRPLLMGTLVGEVSRQRLVIPQGVRPGDRILLTKGIPIETTAILSREFPQRLGKILSATELEEAAAYLYQPGISVLRDAQIAVDAGRVSGMHDPTEGGLSTALWEMAEACQAAFIIDMKAIPISPLSARICQAFDLDPMGAIASGALLLTAYPEDAPAICKALEQEGIPCSEIGYVEEGSPIVLEKMASGRQLLSRPLRDEIGKVYEQE